VPEKIVNLLFANYKFPFLCVGNKFPFLRSWKKLLVLSCVFIICYQLLIIFILITSNHMKSIYILMSINRNGQPSHVIVEPKTCIRLVFLKNDTWHYYE